MEHKGSDAHACKMIHINALFGYLRLSIVDLNKDSNQPFETDGNYSIVYNGEIYN